MDKQYRRDAHGAGQQLSASEISRPLYDARQWMFSLSILSVLAGIILILLFLVLLFGQGMWVLFPIGLVGAVHIWLGALLYSSSEATILSHNRDDGYALFLALVRLRTWFKVYGCSIVLGLIAQVIFLLLMTHKIH
ncbi:MAG: hypothetical protein WCN95_08330 [bacterium]